MSVIGVLQIGVMFCSAGHFQRRQDRHLDGFLMMTVVLHWLPPHSGCFQLFASLEVSRMEFQHSDSDHAALGGSMVPRYLMSDELRQYGLWTFNAWALDGYTKVFWRELPVEALAPQLAVLLVSGVVFLLAARFLALRWETN